MKQETKKEIPLDRFTEHFYRQPVLTEKTLYPEPYRKTDNVYGDSEEDAREADSEAHEMSFVETGKGAMAGMAWADTRRR